MRFCKSQKAIWQACHAMHVQNVGKAKLAEIAEAWNVIRTELRQNPPEVAHTTYTGLYLQKGIRDVKVSVIVAVVRL